MQSLSPLEYEVLVAEIVTAMRAAAPELGTLALGAGSRNRVQGASGYRHQIDVSLFGTDRTFLVECKKWKRRAGVEAVLVLAARASDILQTGSTSKVFPILISSVGFTAGALKVASHYGVQLEIVKSAHLFGLQLGMRTQVAVQDGFAVSDHAEAFISRNGQPVDG